MYTPKILDVNCSVSNYSLRASITVDASTEVLIFRVKFVENSVCVDPFWRSVNADIEERLQHMKHLEKERSQEDANLYQARAIFELGHVTWFNVWTVYLVLVYVLKSCCVKQRLIHI